MIKTKFKLFTYVLLPLAGSFVVLPFVLLSDEGLKPDTPFIAVFGLTLLILFTYLYIVFGELRRKAVYFKMEDDQITLKRYLKLGSKKVYQANFFDGYTVADNGYYEFFCLTKDGHDIIQITAYHHRNYKEVKAFVDERIKYLGQVDYKLFGELKEIFTSIEY